ncbi:MAG: chemotaxis protein CheW [Dehalobacterium sp.]
MDNQFVLFKMAEELYGININCVSEIIRMQQITKIPKTPDFVEGIINLRGKIIPVIDLRKQLELGAADYDQNTRVIVVSMEDETVGIIVEEVTEVFTLPSESIEKIASIESKIDLGFIQGIGKWKDQLIILLETKKILQDQQFYELKEMVLEEPA